MINQHGINADGKVAGHNFSEDGVRAFLYDGKQLVELGALGGASSQANGINRCGHVTGWAMTPNGITHAFLYDGTMRDLAPLGGESVGYAVNDCGVVAGWAVVGGDVHGFVHDGAMRDIGSLGGKQLCPVDQFRWRGRWLFIFRQQRGDAGADL